MKATPQGMKAIVLLLVCFCKLQMLRTHKNQGCIFCSAEKKIISAASKLASMAKVLETPVTKRKLLKTQTSQGNVELFFYLFIICFLVLLN